MFESYRVNRRFVWDGWIYAPKAGTNSSTFDKPVGLTPTETAESYKQQGCWDERSVPPERYAGDVWIVEAGHPNKDAILTRKKVRGDASISSVDDLLADDKFKRLLAPPPQVVRA